MWAIQNRRTKKWVYGTNWDRDGKPVQRTSFDRVLTWEDYQDAAIEFRRRRCGIDYRIVPIKIEEVNDER